MKEFKNLKIEVNAEQPLDEIVKELERLKITYSGDGFKVGDSYIFIARTAIGFQFATSNNYYLFDYFDAPLTTLSKLKEM